MKKNPKVWRSRREEKHFALKLQQSSQTLQRDGKNHAMHLIRKHDPVPAFTKFVAGLKFKMITYLNSKNNYTSRNNIILGFDILPL